MENIFRLKQDVHFYDCDPQRRMKISAVNRLLADMADSHYTALGMDHKWLWQHGFVFLVSKFSIQIDRLPGPREVLDTETWERDIKGAAFLRDYQVKDEQGKPVFSACSSWMLVNPENWQIMRPSLFHEAHPTGIAADCPDCRRLRMTAGEKIGERIVRYSDLDANGHVYNAVYADIAADVIPETLRCRELYRYQVNFIHQAVLGDTITLFLQQINDHIVNIKGIVGDHDCFLCEFEYRP